MVLTPLPDPKLWQPANIELNVIYVGWRNVKKNILRVVQRQISRLLAHGALVSSTWYPGRHTTHGTQPMGTGAVPAATAGRQHL